MTARLYDAITVQNPDTGEFERTYGLLGTIKCYASGIAASGKDVPGTFESFNRQGEYSSTDYVRIVTRAPVEKDNIVSFIKSANGVMWEEDDGTPTIYDSNGSAPIVDASGNIVEYVTMLTRSEVQDVERLV
jgi:hypothetical protein